ncbi:MAG: hypothetical protein IMX04_00410 [Candidatus Carbobacillus altaicus]|nr:hypothetical protein [Candidatus Carbobacillus altaicus]
MAKAFAAAQADGTTYVAGAHTYNWFAFAIVIYVLLVIILNAGFFTA